MNNNYIPLYRKYRPQTIEQIVGQSHIKQALANAINMDRISHAYLFTGPRGTGKTSTARIFAKSLNCKNGPTVTPCNECENCKNITNSIPIDVIEIDAASNRSVNDAEEIIQNVALSPIQSKYKIYIIDEVHMLTPQAFNALLKTLEEPPKNVIFILATTEVHKVLDTIKSRCQRFDFKRITTDDIVNHLKYISQQEGINISDDALVYIAQNSAGGMRDSIALLDQLSVLSSKEKQITTDDINTLLGRLSFGSLSDLFKSIVLSDAAKSLEQINDIYSLGNDPIQILSNLLEFYRNALIVKSSDISLANGIVQLNKEQLDILTDLVKDVEMHQLLSLIDMCCEYIKLLKTTTNPKLWLDVAVLGMSNLTQNTKLEDLQKRIAELEAGNVQIVKPQITVETKIKPVSKPVEKTVKSQTKEQESQISQVVDVPTSQKQNNKDSGAKQLWEQILPNITEMALRVMLKQQAIPVVISSEEVVLAIKSATWLTKFEAKNDVILHACQSVLGEGFNNLTIRASHPDDDKKVKAQTSDSSGDQKKNKQIEVLQKPELPKENEPEENEVTPAEIEQGRSQKTENFHVKDSVHSDNVNMVLQLFEGKIIE